MEGITVGGPGFVAVGAAKALGYPHNAQPAVWTSPDGVTWTRVPPNKVAPPNTDGRAMLDVASGGPGLVAVGTDLIDRGGPVYGAVWTSLDGFKWQRVEHAAVFEGDTGRVFLSGVSTAGPGLVAVGFEERGHYLGVAHHAVVLTSPDGYTWTRVPHNEALFGGADNTMTRMEDVTAGGPGIVAAGFAQQPGSGLVGALWTSPDGTDWTRVPTDNGVFGGARDVAVLSVAADGLRLVAVGGWHIAQSWTSNDGLEWQRTFHDPDAPSNMTDVVSTDVGLVAVGSIDSGKDRYPAVWTSVDGSDWHLDEADLGLLGEGTMEAVAADGDRLVAVGWAWENEASDNIRPVVWTAVLDG